MGHDSFQLHVKGTTQEAVVAAYESELPEVPAIVTRAVNGWVTVLDGSWTPENGGVVCKACRVPGLVVAVYRSSLLCYHLFDEKGTLCDESTCPEDAENISSEDRLGLSGDLTVVGEVLGCDASAVRRVLEVNETFREDNLWAMAELLGIETTGCNYAGFLVEGANCSVDELGGWAGFVHIDPSS